MKCPKCSKEISDNALFCGYCGAMTQKQAASSRKAKSASTPPCGAQDNTEKTGSERAAPSSVASEAAVSPKKKKRAGLSIFLVFCILSVIAGAALGFIVARGIIDLRDYIPTERFMWTDISEGVLQADAPDPVEDSKGKEDSSSSAQKTETTVPSESENAAPQETTDPTASQDDSTGAIGESADAL